MATGDIALDVALLVRLCRHPHQVDLLSSEHLSHVLDHADRARLLGWFLSVTDTPSVLAERPDWLVDRVQSARARAREYERAVRWEVDRISRAFRGSSFPWIFLKGSAYVSTGLPPGRGRRVADIDVMVPHHALGEAEIALREHGWLPVPHDEYDDRYYREWMHELPPMIHKERQSVIDLHHAILPRTSRLRPSTDRLFERSALAAPDRRVLSPAHRVLHAAAHLFHDGEIAGAVRDLFDLDALFRWFGRDERFWPDFLQEAKALQLTRPAYYAVRYSRRLLDTPIPTHGAETVVAWKPNAAVERVMDTLVERTLLGSSGAPAAAFALYVRSHWLRMPPLLLGKHLLHKASKSRRR